MPDNSAAEQGTLEERLRSLQKRKSWWGLLRSLMITAAVVYLLFGVVFGIAVVQGDSMTPAIRNGDIVLFVRLGGGYRLGDIVLIRTEGREDYVKRICALPGETVEIDEDEGNLLVNGEPAIEPYAYSDTYGKPGVTYPLTLAEDEYFCLGDNRSNSMDSRNYGAVFEEQIDGKALAVFRLF